jgi:hypothetical protein
MSPLSREHGMQKPDATIDREAAWTQGVEMWRHPSPVLAHVQDFCDRTGAGEAGDLHRS